MNIPQEMDQSANKDHFVCPLCQAENRANAKFCRLCGQPRLNLDKTLEREIERATLEESEKIEKIQEKAIVEIAPQKLEQVQTNNKFPKSTLCAHCQVRIRGTDNYCSWCGQQNAAHEGANGLRCPSCEQQLPAQANFCFSCGVHVGPHKRLRLRPPGEIFQSEDEEFFPTFDA